MSWCHLELLPRAVVAVTICLAVTVGRAQIPKTVGFQAVLTDAGGDPVPDGAYDLTFRVYGTASGGSQLWSESHTGVMVAGGVLEAILGASAPLTLDFNQQYWVGVTVGSNPELTPRLPFTGSPYALNASLLNGSAQVVRTVEGVSDSVDLEAGSNVSIEVIGHTIRISSSGGAGGGDITAVHAGTGLTGGGETGDVTLAASNPLVLSGDTEGVIRGIHSGGSEGFLGGLGLGVGGVTSDTWGIGVGGESGATTGTTAGVYGGCWSTAGTGVVGISVATDGEGYGVSGMSHSLGGAGVRGTFEGTGEQDGVGVYGESTPTDYYGIGGAFKGGYIGAEGIVKASGNGTYMGLVGVAVGGGGENRGVEALAEGDGSSLAARCTAYGGPFSVGVMAYAEADTACGVYGRSTGGAQSIGIRGENLSSNGVGVLGESPPTQGYSDGVWGISRSDNGWGVHGWCAATAGAGIGVQGFTDTPYGAGVAGRAWATSGEAMGVVGMTDSPSGYGIYYVGGLSGSGAKNCVVKTSDGPRLLYCQESPEPWFEDFGSAVLVQGRAHVDLDPLFLETVSIGQGNPLRVFIELGGDCRGVYVIKGDTGFDVIERQGGTSSIPFDFRVVAKRKGFEDRRLDVCEAAWRDPYLYPETSDALGAARQRSDIPPSASTRFVHGRDDKLRRVETIKRGHHSLKGLGTRMAGTTGLQ